MKKISYSLLLNFLITSEAFQLQTTCENTKIADT